MVCPDKMPRRYFNPRAPCGARRSSRSCLIPCRDFNPRAPCGARRGWDGAQSTWTAFQSTRPVWGATVSGGLRDVATDRFQSTRPVWGATWERTCMEYGLSQISIHAPRVGRDAGGARNPAEFMHFNPRAPCGARPSIVRSCFATVPISIHAPRVGRDSRRFPGKVWLCISIHAPRVGRDSFSFPRRVQRRNFNPRAPCGARQTGPLPGAGHPISIHAPRVGRDRREDEDKRLAAQFQSTRPVWGATTGSNGRGRTGRHFNPRAPCGARRPRAQMRQRSARFQSTRPVWGATAASLVQFSFRYSFQSTRPVWGATLADLIDRPARQDFNPRAPCGARLAARQPRTFPARYFNPRAPCGARRHQIKSKYKRKDFNPRAPCGARQQI